MAVNQAAMALGLRPGTSLADARAVEPDLIAQDHDPVADSEFLDRIADACLRYTPMVAVEPPDGLMLDITGCTHITDSEPQFARAVQEWLRHKGLESCHACASTAEAAHALARFSRKAIPDETAAIRALPVAALQLDPEAELGLRRAGLETIGDVMDRPRHVITARFGAASVYQLERLIGEASKPIAVRSLPERHLYRRRFVEPIASQAYALKVLRELLDEANLELSEKDLGGRAFEARFCRVDGLVQRLQIETGRPTRDSTAVARLFDERLDGLSDPLDPGFGYDSVELAVLRTEPLKPAQDNLERDKQTGKALAETLDVLATRLGRNRLLRFQPNDTHIPEYRQFALSALDGAQTLVWSRPHTGEPPSRPLNLFDPPHRIIVIAQIPDGPPKRFRWRKKLRDIVRHEGPERIAAEWWKNADKRAQDPLGRDQLTRDYYRIEDSDGRRYWVFRHGLYGRESDDPSWYLHGLFA